MIRLAPGVSPIGDNAAHRSGWPYAIRSLAPIATPDGILFDDFVERTFLYRLKPPAKPWTEPWIGIFHHPPHMPDWFHPDVTLQRLWKVPGFVQSLPRLRGAIALSEHLGIWLRAQLAVPVCVVKHPSEIPEVRFNLQAYLARPTIVQVGWFLRNQDAIYQVPVPDGVDKLHLQPYKTASHRTYAERMRREGPYRQRRKVGHVLSRDGLPAAAYDALLARSVVFIELVDGSATNTVIEAIARQTPILVNRLPATEEYLGADYPLFYRDLSEVPALLTPERIAAAHAYLRALDASWLAGERFCAAVSTFVSQVRAEVAA